MARPHDRFNLARTPDGRDVSPSTAKAETEAVIRTEDFSRFANPDEVKADAARIEQEMMGHIARCALSHLYGAVL